MVKNCIFLKLAFCSIFLITTCLCALPSNGSDKGKVEGSFAYLRVKEYSTKPNKNTTPKGQEIKLAFGDSVKLKQETGSLPMIWLASTEKGEVWIPDFYLTAKKKEIDFLRTSKRVPSTMTFIYEKDGHIEVYGLVRLGMLIVDSQGLAASAGGSHQVAFVNNAVVFDYSALEYDWTSPMIMSCGNITHKLRADYLYYCNNIDNDGKACFDCIDLGKLSFCEK